MKIMNSTILKKLSLLLVSAFCFYTAHAQDDVALAAIKKHREKQEAEFKDPEKSPLDRKQIRHFKGLNYFPPDLVYHVKATLVKSETPALFKMKTTTNRLPDFRKYGEVHFELMGNAYSLEVYQSPDISKESGYEDYLFIPFTDETNGNETYEVGRYVEMRIPVTNEVDIDFNLCYNPYCSYRAGYSCPIPPAANHLPIAILAGEKKFLDHH